VGGKGVSLGFEQAEGPGQVTESGEAVRARSGWLVLAEAERSRFQMLPGQLDLPRDRVDPRRRFLESLFDGLAFRFHPIRHRLPKSGHLRHAEGTSRPGAAGATLSRAIAYPPPITGH
jgi:hypothetical protein